MTQGRLPTRRELNGLPSWWNHRLTFQAVRQWPCVESFHGISDLFLCGWVYHMYALMDNHGCSSSPVLFLFWDRIPHWPGIQRVSCFCPPSTGIYKLAPPNLAFSGGFWGVHSDPCVCMGSSLLTELSHGALSFSFLFDMLYEAMYKWLYTNTVTWMQPEAFCLDKTSCSHDILGAKRRKM